MSEKNYPSAEFLQSVCAADYYRLIDTYDKIYDKVNIALAFSGAILLVIISGIDYTVVKTIHLATNKELFYILSQISLTTISAVCIIWSVLQLLLLLKSRTITLIDSIAIRNEEVYREDIENAAVWLIDKYTLAIPELKKANEEKQKKFDSAIIKIIISIITYAIILIMQKGV